MANYLVRLRSPFFLNETSSQASGSADLVIKINNVNQYVISKNTISNNVIFEVSELIKDYLDVTWDGVFPYSTTTKNSLVITAEIDINFFTGTKEQRAILAESSTQLIEHNIYGFDAYSEFNEGSNKQLVSGQLLQSNTTMYLPETGNAYVPSESSNGVTYTTILTQ